MDRDLSSAQRRRRRLALGAKTSLALAALAALAWSAQRFLRPSVERADLRIGTVEGTVRELRHCVERAALMSAKPLLARADFETVTGAPEATPKDRLDRDVLPLDAVEKLMIGRAMRQCEGNVTRASELLGLSRAALYRRLAKHGLPTQ